MEWRPLVNMGEMHQDCRSQTSSEVHPHRHNLHLSLKGSFWFTHNSPNTFSCTSLTPSAVNPPFPCPRSCLASPWGRIETQPPLIGPAPALSPAAGRTPRRTAGVPSTTGHRSVSAELQMVMGWTAASSPFKNNSTEYYCNHYWGGKKQESTI